MMLGFAALGVYSLGEVDRGALAFLVEWLAKWRRRGRR
jgi:hypothetical protein